MVLSVGLGVLIGGRQEAPGPVPIPVPFNPQDTVIDREIGPIPANSGADDFGGVGRPRVASEWLRLVRRITLKPFEPKNVFP